MQVTTISAFRANIKQYYDNVLLTEEPLIITKGDTGAVLIPLQEYNAMQRRLEILGNSSVMKDIREGIRQMAAGQLIEVTDIDAL
ncbi:MAG: type II toxin-antitoxin system Phd/YefM family antitoxin [Bacteroidales bacterium]|jgi:PHD/YefM family antitoxin component YafN of YafNO toxin-antitoxin module|nr:type II toxin-antitoxin system Phd/YefM family antitoxin [Bacteroidales bacterium]MBQ2091333.1 type II toxin-antitoxin system Phd/YefM family antitoxin [Bacteroidales bacterium]